MAPQKNGYVRWYHLVPTLIVLSLALAGYVHAISNKAMSKDVFVQFEKRFDDNMVRILDEIKSLKK